MSEEFNSTPENQEEDLPVVPNESASAEDEFGNPIPEEPAATAGASPANINIKCGIAPQRIYAFTLPAGSTVEQAIHAFKISADAETPNQPVDISNMDVRLNGNLVEDYDAMLVEGDRIYLSANKKGAAK